MTEVKILSEERLQKLISHAGIASRRAAEKMISEGRVKVDGQIVKDLGTKVNPDAQKIFVDDKPLTFDERKIYVLLNKPQGYVSTAKDERGRKTVLDLISEIPERVYPVGRLDVDSEGLILLTNDGELTNALIHPKFEIEKTYRAKVSGEITPEKFDELRSGVELEDGKTAPAKIEILSLDENSAVVNVTIHEGKNRQIRRMFAAVGCTVRNLKRIKFAGLTLDGVKTGSFRFLTNEEVEILKRHL